MEVLGVESTRNLLESHVPPRALFSRDPVVSHLRDETGVLGAFRLVSEGVGCSRGGTTGAMSTPSTPSVFVQVEGCRAYPRTTGQVAKG